MPRCQDSHQYFALRHPLRFVWGVFADLFLVVETTIFGIVAIATVLLTRSGHSADIVTRIWARLIVLVCGIRIEARGLENVQPGRSCVIISNHLGNADICTTIVAVARPLRFVAKKQLQKVPIFGQALALSGHIIIDRKKPLEAIKTINAAADRNPTGIAILFYAEGTRSLDGRVQPFKKGGVTLALRSGLPIVPLSVSGTRKFLPKGSIVIRPGGRVRLVFAKPIETRGLSLAERDKLNERVHEIVARNYDPEL